ncbi:hypothetical protein BDZ89DRAFT_1041000 [Hymenopellis radicata]|nr:hypothetical protein BDZ89DRAFT_1041000 [Hymenopellis radicata]
MADQAELNAVVRKVIAPVLIGVIVHAFLLGLVCVQYVTYFTSRFNDHKFIVAIVVWLAFVDIALTLNSVTVIWQYVIDHFADVTVLSSTTWNFNLFPVVSTFSAIPVQLFLANRIRRFSNSWILFGALVVLILGPAVMGCLTSVQLQSLSALSDRDTARRVGYAWLALNVGCDTILSSLMIFYLRRQKTAFARTNKIISRYVQLAIQSALPVTLSAITILTLGITMVETNMHTPFTLCLGRFYTEYDNSYNFNSINLSAIDKRARQDVSIAVTHTEETHIDSEWLDKSDLADLRKSDRVQSHMLRYDAVLHVHKNGQGSTKGPRQAGATIMLEVFCVQRFLPLRNSV